MPDRAHQRGRVIFLTAVILILFLEVVGTAFFVFVEGWSTLDALYFTTTTLTTIGFGDHVPRTDLGKIFTIFFAFAGVGTVLFSVTLVSELYFRSNMAQIGKLERKIHQLLTPRRILQEEEKLEKEAEELERKEKELAKQEREVSKETAEIEKEKKELRKVIGEK